jgi:hypothetical protein
MAIGWLEMSRKFLLQGVNAESFVRHELLRTAATAVDQAIFAGAGNNGEPYGLANTPNVQVQAGTGLSHANAAHMKALVTAENAPDDELAFIAPPGVREVLETRERAAGNGYVWDANNVASVVAHVSTDMPTACLALGPWSDCLLALWGSGIVVELNNYGTTQFQRGIAQWRVVVSCDVGFAHPPAFCWASAIN